MNSKPRWSHLEKIHKTYSLEQNQHIKMPCLECDLRIIVTGKSGVGKSATANTILGEELFPENVSLEVSSLTSEYHTETVDGRKITVMETPCLSTLESLEEILRRRIIDTMVKFAKSAHAFVYVFNMASPRFTKEDKLALAAIESLFEGEMKENRVLVYTHAESCLSNDMNLDQFFRRQTSKDTEVANLLRGLNGNIVAVNNKSEIPEEIERNQNVIIGLVDKVVKESEDVMYSNMMLKTTANVDGKQLLTFSDKSHSHLIRDTIEMVLGINPNLSNNQGKLILKVRRQLEEDLERHIKIVSAITLKQIEEEYFEMQNKSYFTTGDKKVHDSGNMKGRIASVNTTLETTVLEDKGSKRKGVYGALMRGDHFPSRTKMSENWMRKSPYHTENDKMAKSSRNINSFRNRDEEVPADIDQDDSVPTTTKRLKQSVYIQNAHGNIEGESSVPTRAKKQKSFQKTLDVPHVKRGVRTISPITVNFSNVEHRQQIPLRRRPRQKLSFDPLCLFD